MNITEDITAITLSLNQYQFVVLHWLLVFSQVKYSSLDSMVTTADALASISLKSL